MPGAASLEGLRPGAARGLGYPRAVVHHSVFSVGMTLLTALVAREECEGPGGKARRVEPPPGFEPGTPGSLGNPRTPVRAYEAGALPAELRRRLQAEEQVKAAAGLIGFSSLVG